MYIRKRSRHCGDYGKRSEFMQVSYYPYTKGKRQARRKRKEQTSTPSQRNLNDKRARRYLEALVHSNFRQGDLHVSLSYSEENRPKDKKDAKRMFRNFIGRINYRRKKMGLENARWVCVIEQGKNGRIHHHAIMDGELDRDMVEAAWGYGYANTRRLRPDKEKGILPLVHYIAKEFKEKEKVKNERKWDSSKNMKKPWDTVNDDPRQMSKKKFRLMKEIPEDSACMKEIIEQDNPGYKLISVEREYWEETGIYTFFCRMRLAFDQEGKTKRCIREST